MYEIAILILIASILVFIFLMVDIMIEKSDHRFFLAEWLLLIIILGSAMAQVISFDKEVAKIQETTIMEFVDGTVTYDTLSMDKNSKLLQIELKRND